MLGRGVYILHTLSIWSFAFFWDLYAKPLGEMFVFIKLLSQMHIEDPLILYDDEMVAISYLYATDGFYCRWHLLLVMWYITWKELLGTSLSSKHHEVECTSSVSTILIQHLRLSLSTFMLGISPMSTILPRMVSVPLLNCGIVAILA